MRAARYRRGFVDRDLPLASMYSLTNVDSFTPGFPTAILPALTFPLFWVCILAFHSSHLGSKVSEPIPDNAVRNH